MANLEFKKALNFMGFVATMCIASHASIYRIISTDMSWAGISPSNRYGSVISARHLATTRSSRCRCVPNYSRQNFSKTSLSRIIRYSGARTEFSFCMPCIMPKAWCVCLTPCIITGGVGELGVSIRK